MVDITIEVEDTVYVRFSSMCTALGKDAITFLQGQLNAAMENRMKMLSKEFDMDISVMKPSNDATGLPEH